VGLSVTVLGCCGSYPGPGGACSGYLVTDGRTMLWLDAGSGTMANLQRHVDPGAVDAVVLSHEHPDHWADLEGYRVFLQHVSGREGVAVYAPAGLRERTYGNSEPWLAWSTIADGDTLVHGSLSLTFSRTDHPPETLAVRIDGGGRSLGYSADTGTGWSLEALGPGLDLALCEATIPRDHEGEVAHLTAAQAGTMARAAGARRLVLTHLWPTLDADRAAHDGAEAFGGPVAVARTGARLEI
jgi:ribonuclease BN (tRNA processing enzyme)